MEAGDNGHTGTRRHCSYGHHLPATASEYPDKNVVGADLAEMNIKLATETLGADQKTNCLVVMDFILVLA